MGNFISFNDFQNKTKNLSSQNSVSNKISQNIPVKQELIQQKPDTVELANSSNVIQEQSPVIEQKSVIPDTNKTELTNQLNKAKNQNGLIEKLADKIKSILNFGISSKSIEKSINENKSKEDVEKDIKNYRRSQENIAQGVGDVASSLAGATIFFKAKEFLQIQLARLNVNPDKIKDLAQDVDSAKLKKVVKTYEKFTKNKYAPLVVATIPAMFVAGLVKNYILKANRIATKQYKPNVTSDMSKKEAKIEKKKANKNKGNADLRNFASGLINGLTMPVVGILGVGGIPIHLAINSLNRYFIASREDRGEKSIKSYIENIKTSPVGHILPALFMAISMVKKSQFDGVFEKNLPKVVKEIKEANLQDMKVTKSAYEQLEEIMFNDSKVSQVLNSAYSSDDIGKTINELTDTNIIAVKFKQITDSYDSLTRALKEGCPTTWTRSEVANKLKKAFGDKYTLVSSCGAGTVAETYVVKDANGKEYCIKMLKKGITRKKIEQDTQAFINMINNMKGKSKDEKEFLIKNAKNIAQGILDEVDFNNEFKSAQELTKVTKKAHVVKGIEVKDDMYVMEKANGVSLKKLTDYLSEKQYPRLDKDIEYYSKYNNDYSKNRLVNLLERKKEFEQMQKAIGDISKSEAKKMLMAYQDIMVEQFDKIGKSGKTIHGDIHAGNIIIDVDAMRKGQKDFFTLIDTGNTIKLDSKQALRTLNISKYIANGDVENITSYVLEDAKLPKGMSLEEANKAFGEKLSKVFFDSKTNIGPVTNQKLFSITDSIMKDLGIIPGSNQGALDKTRKSAETSLNEFKATLGKLVGEEIKKKFEKDGLSAGTIAKGVGSAIKDMGLPEIKYMLHKKFQQWLNQFSFTPSQRAKIKHSQSAPKKNSEDYLRYAIKQFKFNIDDFNAF